MEELLQTVGLAATLALTSVAMPASPVVGNWQLNLAKSKFSPGPAPKTGHPHELAFYFIMMTLVRALRPTARK